MTLLNPDMPSQELRLHMSEMTADEMRVARAAIRWANSAACARLSDPALVEVVAREILKNDDTFRGRDTADNMIDLLMYQAMGSEVRIQAQASIAAVKRYLGAE